MNKKIVLYFGFITTLVSFSFIAQAMRCGRISGNNLDVSFLNLIAAGDQDRAETQLERIQKAGGLVDLNAGIYDKKKKCIKLPLEVAITNNQGAMAQWLVQNGATTQTICAEGCTMLGTALLYLTHHPKDALLIIALLLDHKADPNAYIFDRNPQLGQSCTTPLEQALLSYESAQREDYGQGSKRAQLSLDIARVLVAAGGKLEGHQRLAPYLEALPEEKWQGQTFVTLAQNITQENGTLYGHVPSENLDQAPPKAQNNGYHCAIQ